MTRRLVSIFSVALLVATCSGSPTATDLDCFGHSLLRDELSLKGTDLFVIVKSTPPVQLSKCQERVFLAAVAWWEQALRDDSRVLTLALTDPGPTWATSAYGSGSGPTASPEGLIAIGRDYWDAPIISPVHFYDLVRHELAHALGFGSGNPWRERLVNPFTGDRDNLPDTHFRGRQAHEAFLALGGGEFYRSQGVPVANGSPGPALPNSHWRFNIIVHETMAGCSERYSCDSHPAPVSRITLGALADMGWVVDMSMAEAGTRVGNFQ